MTSCMRKHRSESSINISTLLEDAGKADAKGKFFYPLLYETLHRRKKMLWWINWDICHPMFAVCRFVVAMMPPTEGGRVLTIYHR
mmetsp:Transcript_13724/g.29840  ORF Transcript_13724/g.29840 Transcript_13724/m.29840 type:complete len:85 (-) Transcript_13724:836-1090(-)